MALNFLTSALSGIGKAATGISRASAPFMGILDAISNVRGASDQRKAEKRILDMAVNQPATDAERYALSMQKALADPNNSLVKQLQAEEFQMLMNAINQGIQGKVLSDRREASMGRRPTFFDPERADENISYQLSRGAPQALLQARQSALNRVQSAASGVAPFATMQDQRYQNTLQALGTDYMRRYGEGAMPQTNNIQNILKAIQGLATTPGINPTNYGRPMANPNIRGTSYLMS